MPFSYYPLEDMDPTPAAPGVVAQNNNRMLHAKLWAIEELPASSGTIDLDFQQEKTRFVNLTGNVTFTFSGIEIGRTMLVKITADASTRTLTFPSGPAPIFVGAAAPANIAANKTGLLMMRCFGSDVSDVICRWLVQP